MAPENDYSAIIAEGPVPSRACRHNEAVIGVRRPIRSQSFANDGFILARKRRVANMSRPLLDAGCGHEFLLIGIAATLFFVIDPASYGAAIEGHPEVQRATSNGEKTYDEGQIEP